MVLDRSNFRNYKSSGIGKTKEPVDYWYYETDDTDVTTAGYFDGVNDWVKPGDSIECKLGVFPTEVEAKYTVESIAINGTVTVLETYKGATS